MSRRFFKRNRKKMAITGIIMAAILLCVGVASLYGSNILAGVFKMTKNDDGTVSYTYTKNITILEIVAQRGQQILGYTVGGDSAPITNEAIEAYTGDIDFAEFKDATGYDITGTPGNYTVVATNGTKFADDVLDGYMYEDGDTITVKVVTASELSEDDFNNVDLVYINSADYDPNLLYYYDQIMNSGKDGVAKGDYGCNYASTYSTSMSVKEIAVKTITTAAGRASAAKALTLDTFDMAGITNCDKHFITEYISGIAALEKNSLTGSTVDESVTKITAAIEKINEDFKKNAKNIVAGYVDAATLSDDDIVRFKAALSTFNGYVDENADDYVTYIKDNSLRTNKKILKGIAAVNNNNRDNGISTLKNIIAKTLPESFDADGNPIDGFDFTPYVSKAITGIYCISGDYKYIPENIDEYTSAFMGIYETIDAADADNINDYFGANYILTVNDAEKDKAFNTVAGVAGKSGDIAAITEDEFDEYFTLMDLAEYKSYNLEKYITRLGELSEGALSVQKEKPEGGFEWSYSIDKIKNDLFEYVNNEIGSNDVSCDIPSWSVALAMYDKITSDGIALMYNTELLSSKTLGDYTTAPGSSNNMYKLLLVLRQMTKDYFDTVKSSINENGILNGSTTPEWFAGTFCDSYADEGSADKSKFCQPAVVGKVYNADGSVLAEAGTSYVKDNVFAYVPSADDDGYFGGKAFAAEDYKGKAISAAYEEITLPYIRVYFCTKNLDGGNANWWHNCVVAGYQGAEYKYKDLDGNEKTEQVQVGQIATYDMTKNYSSNSYKTNQYYKCTYYVDVPATTSQIYFYINRADWGEFNYTEVYKGTLSDGVLFYITNTASVPGTDSNVTGAANIYNKTLKRWPVTKTEGTKFSGSDKEPQKKMVLKEGDGKTKAEIIREIMGISLNQIQSIPFKILEIQPTGGVSDFTEYKKFQELADWMRVELPAMNETNYNNYFTVETVSVREFDTRHERLNGTYDMVYFGINPGYMNKKTYKAADGTTIERAFYGNSTVMGESYFMNGLVYTGIGQERAVGGSLRGTVASDYSVVGSVKTNVQKDLNIWKEYFFAEFKNGKNYLNPALNYVQNKGDITTRLSGNDITVARMDDLLDYVKGGYPILFADGLLDSDDYVDCTTINAASASYDVASKWKYLDKHTKLYAFIKQAKGLGAGDIRDGLDYASIVSVSNARTGKNPKFLGADEKYKGGLGYAIQRNVQVDFKLIHTPQEYDRDKNGNLLSLGSVGNLEDVNGATCYFTLEPNVNVEKPLEWIKDNYEFKMYIDKSGTGNFNSDRTVELDLADTYFNMKTGQITVATKNSKWPGGVEGFVPWRLVAVNKVNGSNYWEYTGFSAFKKEKRRVNVLWVSCQATNNWGGAQGGSTLDFTGMIDKYKGYIQDYDIRVDKIMYPDFVKNWNDCGDSYDPRTDQRIKVRKLKYYKDQKSDASDEGKEYDMIVFGYSDSYEVLDIDNIHCLKNVDYFTAKAEDGGLDHSLLFAHDNSSYITSFNYYVDANGGKSFGQSHGYNTNFARYNTSYLRGILGMDAYGASFSTEAIVDAPNTADGSFRYLSWLYKPARSLYNARKYLLDDSQISDPDLGYRGAMRGYVDGQVMWYSTGTGDWNYLNGSSKIGTNAYGDWLITKKTECTNKGQISIYPFVIGDELTLGTDTHFQYLKLDVEDDDTTVWYTLSGNKGTYYDATKGDGSNNYYIYSKGNITYTGAGHRKIDNKANECLLFVNTVVAAIKLGNFAPDVTYTDSVSVTTATGQQDVLYGYETDKSLKVTFKATDYDEVAGVEHDFLNAYIFLDKNGNGMYDAGTDKLLNQPAFGGGTTSMLKDASGNVMNISGTELVNRRETTFYLSYTDLADFYTSLHGGSGLSEGKKVAKLFEEDGYRLVVSTINNKTYEKYKNTTDILTKYSFASAKVVIRSLFNLN